MKLMINTIAALSFSLGCSLVSAETTNFDVPLPTTSYYKTYPHLDLSNITGFKIDTYQNALSSSPDTEVMIKQVTFDFENANSLVVKNLKKESGSTDTYVGTVDDVWVYRQIEVRLNITGGLRDNSTVNAEIHIVDHQSYTGTNAAYPVTNPYPDSGANSNISGHLLVHANGYLYNVTPEKIVDRSTLIVDGKELTLSLVQKPRFSMTGPESGFKVKALWMGHGEAPFYEFIPVHDFDARATAIKINEYISPDGSVDHDYSIEYINHGMKQSTEIKPLKPVLDKLFPVMP